MKRIFTFVSIFALILCATSCGDDTEDPMSPVDVADPDPVANFTSVIDGKTATFTSTSTDGRTYEWDFGDGNTSSEENPIHTYERNGSFVVKLTSVNNTGSDSKQAVLEIINVSVDGDFAEWSSIATAISNPTGTITSIKIENLENNKLFLFVEGTADLTPLTQIMLNLDNDRSTGAQIDWRYLMAGEDILIEGSLPTSEEQFAAIYECTPCDGSNPGEWNWGAAPIAENAVDFILASELIATDTGMAYELSIDLTALGQSVSEDAIGISYLDMSTDTWDSVGVAPEFFNENDNPEGTMFIYELK